MMRLFLCDHGDCGVVVFTESDAGSARCPSCGFLGELTSNRDTDRAGIVWLARRVFSRPTPAPAVLR